ncbi:MAG: MBL fold metallo-hydrolase [Bacteroidetes bacterium GWF2_42_66]|nr:MAG: MBL fold metallo-hydrolase [Bacteroidetes bacterium GWE2_42_39]OFY43337.1 MAG: MBL fold metallo-hydrolase [Bacteroidetes bacterium GWF2_42_66]HBL77480.1 MBL fold metallo-hydrolase [Prolixibacteraceae bacterium]HCU61737.1 MBL fold metallo-hydrolase [Prolixibacteraceae bacterium]
MIEICALASGSNGNCYYIGNQTDAVLIDAGISAKQILLRMEQRQLNPAKIRALFITHEHTDHFRGARVLSKRLGIPVFLTQGTYLSVSAEERPAYVLLFSPGETIIAGEFSIHSFPKNHDAAEPCSFRIEYRQTSVGVFTDIGEACENVQTNLSHCRAVFIESNYDEQMLWNGPYPYPLKQRVASSFGHLSNDQSLELVRQHAGDNLEYVFLSHLSKENNTPAKAFQNFTELRARFNVHLTSREEATEVFVLR